MFGERAGQGENRRVENSLSATRELLNEAVRHLDDANTSRGTTAHAGPLPLTDSRLRTHSGGEREASARNNPAGIGCSRDLYSRRACGQTEFVRAQDHTVTYPYRLFNTKGLSMKRQKLNAPRSKRKRVAMWEKEFICLAQVGQTCTPMPLEKADFIRAGLGMASLLLMEHSDSWEFHDELLRRFPKLADGGGYELLRTCGNSRELHVIPPPSGGYTTSYVKSIVNHAKVYVCPLHKDLSLEEVTISSEVVNFLP